MLSVKKIMLEKATLELLMPFLMNLLSFLKLLVMVDQVKMFQRLLMNQMILKSNLLSSTKFRAMKMERLKCL